MILQVMGTGIIQSQYSYFFFIKHMISAQYRSTYLLQLLEKSYKQIRIQTVSSEKGEKCSFNAIKFSELFYFPPYPLHSFPLYLRCITL